MSLTVNEGDLFMVRIEYRDSNENVAYNVLHYRCKEINPTPPALYVPQPVHSLIGNIVGTVLEEFTDNWKTGGSSSVRITGATGQSIAPAPKSAAFHYASPDDGVPGEVAGDALPLQDCVTILKETAYGYRWGLGRVFVPGIPESGQHAGIISEGQATLWDGLVVAIRNLQTFVVDEVEYIFEPVLYGQHPPGTFVATPVLSARLSDRVIKTQRRRRPGKGI